MKVTETLTWGGLDVSTGKSTTNATVVLAERPEDWAERGQGNP